MRLVTIDFETHYAQDYSLSKMTPLGYVMDPRFQFISCSIKVDHHPTDVVFGEAKIRRAFKAIDHIVRDSLLLAHNMSGFDAYVCAYRLGVRPKLWGCTMAMARPIHAKTTGLGLAKLVAHYADELRAMGISPVKDNTALVQTRGKRLEDFTPAELEAMRTYNRTDTDQCYGLFHILRHFYTPAELWQIDAITRMRTEPQFELDRPLLEVALSVERSNKHKALIDLARDLRHDQQAGDADLDWSNEEDVARFVRGELASAPKFSAMLERLGAEVPMKPSPTNPTKQVPALAKTDEAFIALQESDDPLVAAAARARLSVKSTLLETRIGKFLTAGGLAGGMLPVPLRYAGADTTGRDSGEEYNCFTGEVEVLTRAGWVRFDAWQGQPIMQWWPDGRAAFEEHPATLAKPYAGVIIDVDAVLVSAAMTPEHRIPAVRDGNVRDYAAADLTRLACLNGLVSAGTYEGSSESAYTPDEVRLMVAIAADGCVVQRKSHFDIQIGLRRTRKIERLLHLLDQVRCTFYTREYPPQDTHTGEHNTVQFILPACKYPKGFGPWVLNLSRESMDALVDELRHWDGWSHATTGAVEFSTSSLDQAEWVSTALHLSGKPASVRHYRGSRYQMHARESVHTSVSNDAVTTRHYEGVVYCAGVESSYIFIRRNGKISVSGNCQNLPRVNPDKPKTSDALRMSLRAPKGKVVIVADQTGIELRTNHFLWRVPSSMALYQASPDKADLYREFAASYLYKIDPSAITKTQRQMGKVAQLGLGFGSGAFTFKRIAKTMGGIEMELARTKTSGPDLTAEEVVASWRSAYVEIVDGWKQCARSVLDIARGIEAAVDPWGLVHTCREGFVLPSGRIIRYPDLREEDDGEWPDGRPRRSWFYAHGRHKARITGPKADENIVQALARDSIFDCSVEFYRRTQLRPALRVHDELVYVVEERHGQELLDELQAIMRTPPKWWPGLVVWSEGDMAANYGAAK